MKIIDTHIHLWDLENGSYPWLEGDSSILNRSYFMDELEEQRKGTAVEYGVLVQAANNDQDTVYMLKVAEESNWIKGVVGWLPLTDPKQSEKLLEQKYLQNPYFKGVRHLIHNESDPNWLLQPSVLESLKILADNELPFDVVGVLPEHLETAIKVAEQLPNLNLVLDHLNQPPIAQKLKFGNWGVLMEKASRYPNIHVKISGLGTTTGRPHQWLASDIYDYLEFVIGEFGYKRCFLGGDWPVSLLAGSYTYTWKQYENTLVDLLNENELKSVCFENAAEFYNLNIKL